MKPELPLKIFGREILLLAGKALYWPEHRLLCVADLHFGKAAAYRALSQPVPRGTTGGNLSRLDGLLAKYPADYLVFLGDFLHARQSRAPGTLAELQRWRQRHARLECTLVRGNHDVRAGDPPKALNFKVVNEPLLLPPFALRHRPGRHPEAHVIAGHVHPVFLLQGKGHQKLRLPCFYTSQELTVLPSFGDFTGGFHIDPTPDRQIVVTDGTGLWPVVDRRMKKDRGSWC